MTLFLEVVATIAMFLFVVWLESHL